MFIKKKTPISAGDYRQKWLKHPANASVLILVPMVLLAACVTQLQTPTTAALNSAVSSVQPTQSTQATQTQPAPTSSPQAAADELLNADEAFSRASMSTDLVTGLSAMFAADVMMPLAENKFAIGAAEATAALSNNADNAKSKIEWQPVRVGISADGQHGFTMGVMTLYKDKADKTTVPQKYLAYWVKQEQGWRVAAYRRAASDRWSAGPASVARMASVLPAKMFAVADHKSRESNIGNKAALEKSLADTERAFSQEAQTIGIGAAFVKYGSREAVHLGGRKDTGFIVGAKDIARTVAADAPPNGSHVNWAPDKVIVAASGDFGVTFGFIKSNKPTDPAVFGAPPAAQSAGFPFFTIWHRASADQPWRYVAE